MAKAPDGNIKEIFFEVFDQENCSSGDTSNLLQELIEYSRSRLPVYCTESQDGVFAFFSNIPITDERVQQWYTDIDV